MLCGLSTGISFAHFSPSDPAPRNQPNQPVNLAVIVDKVGAEVQFGNRFPGIRGGHGAFAIL